MFQSDAELVKRVRDVGDSAAYGELDIGADKRFLRHACASAQSRRMGSAEADPTKLGCGGRRGCACDW